MSELKATRDLLSISLSRVHDLELGDDHDDEEENQANERER